MKRITLVLTLLLSVFIAGCVPKSTAIHASPGVTPITTNAPISSPTPTGLAADWETSKSCVTESSTHPEINQLNGVAVLRSLNSVTIDLSLSFIDLRDGTSSEINTSNQSIWDADVSPDRDTLAYKWFNSITSKWELVLLDALGEMQGVAWSSENDFSFQGWLNSHQLVIAQDFKYLLVDPYRNSQEMISPSDFPDFDSFNSRFFVAFDPSLSKAIYKNDKITLLDLSTNTIIAQINDGYDRTPIISWRPSGDQLAIVATISAEQNSFGFPDEIFVVENNGQIKQLTHLYDVFGLALTIESLSWSPDGSKIAFWLQDGQGNLTLMVSDYATGKTINYCISNVVTTTFPINVSAPIWSSDGKYLMVENRYATDKNKLFVVDLLSKLAFPIAENANPIDWMVTP